MMERPILFSGPMVTAILDGRKTQTRRVMKPQIGHVTLRDGNGIIAYAGSALPKKDGGCWLWPNAKETVLSMCPHGVPGDRLWVRETWAVDAPLDQVRRENEDVMGAPDLGHGPYFRADPVHENSGLRWRVSIHLPRWASRLTLEITEVRVGRLTEISEEDARAEGVEPCGEHKALCAGRAHRNEFAVMWNTINGRKAGAAWKDDPYVWAISFRKIAQ